MSDEAGGQERFERFVVFDANVGPVWRGVIRGKTAQVKFEDLPEDLRPESDSDAGKAAGDDGAAAEENND
jgi:hypothetical protein